MLGKPKPRKLIQARRLLPLALVLMSSASLGFGQNFSPYSDFQAMSAADLQTLQILLTPFAPQDEINPSLAIIASGATLNAASFVPFERPGFLYSNTITVITVSIPELQSIIANVGTLSNVTAGGVASKPKVSFLMVNQGKGFQAILNAADATALFGQLRASLANNKAALLSLQLMSCPLNLVDPGTPVDVSSSVSVALSGFRLNRASNRFVGSATLKNTSSSDLPAPISLVVLPSAAVSLANLDGNTCNIPPFGAAFINLPGQAGLAAGASAQLQLEFDNPNFQPIQITSKVLSGPGGR